MTLPLNAGREARSIAPRQGLPAEHTHCGLYATNLG
jgi:hypothetical protein